MSSPSTSSGRILWVGPADRAPELVTALAGDSWDCTRIESPRGALRHLRGDSAIDVVVVTPGSPLSLYTELCRNIKSVHRHALVSAIFVLPPEAAHQRSDVFEAGADDCIQLPAPVNEIVLRLLNAIRIKRASDSLEDATTVITSLANAIEGRDAYTCGHVERVAIYSVEIGKRLGLDSDDLAAIRMGAMVHDIGKVAVPDRILNKRGKLNEEEWTEMKRHPIIGYDILKPLRTFRSVLPIVRWHHEKPNGTGYPDRLKGETLPLLPRIVAVADCYDAIGTDRPYRPALNPSECKDILSRGGANGDLDCQVANTMLEIVQESEATLVGAGAEASGA